MANEFDDLSISDDLLLAYDRPVPRYTSYPTAPVWEESFTPADFEGCLASLPPGRGLSLYVHLPFCRERCVFCGCNVTITSRKDVATRYISTVIEEMERISEVVGDLPSRPVQQIHWGGGTPTFPELADIERLARETNRIFPVARDAEVSIEVDPRVTTAAHLKLLREVGFNRLSLGVQDFDPAVQVAVNRIQPRSETAALIAEARRLGFESISVDLIYGLPRQTRASFSKTVDSLLALGPDRVSLFSYAHVPWLKRHQRAISPDQLPTPTDKIAIFLDAIRAFTTAGYEFIGLDHFAAPGDELSRQHREGGLHRNFQGYSTRDGLDLIGCGVSAISALGDTYAQNHSKLADYYRSLEQGNLATHRGHRITDDDRLRRTVISDLMCNSRLDFAEIEKTFGIDFRTYFRAAVDALARLEEDRLIDLIPEGIDLTPRGRLFVRNICSVFDAYLDPATRSSRGV